MELRIPNKEWFYVREAAIIISPYTGIPVEKLRKRIYHHIKVGNVIDFRGKKAGLQIHRGEIPVLYNRFKRK